MKFRLVEEKLKIEKYEGWTQEDIDLYESIDWDEQGDSDFDAGFAYLDSAVLYTNDDVQRAETEFHKFFKKDPYSRPYYMPIDTKPFEVSINYVGPISKGDMHRDYEVYNQYDLVK